MKILFIGPLPEPLTGHSLACKVLSDELRKLHDVCIINLSKANLKCGFISWNHCLRTVWILSKIRKEQKRADVIYLTISESVLGNIKDLLIYLLCFRKLRRMVVHLHGGSIRAWIFDKYLTLRRINKYLLSKTGRVIVLGNSLADLFAGVVAKEKIHIVPNFAEDYLFTTELRIVEKYFKTETIRILFLSNMISGKGYEDVIDAYIQLDEDQQDRIVVDFAGLFESEATEHRFRARIGQFRNLHYLGAVRGTRKREVLESAHLFCLPTELLEGQPISILEAYASGCVVITTNRGGIWDIFQPSVNGFEIIPKQPKSLKVVFERILASPDKLLPIAVRNFRTAQQCYRSDQYLRRVGSILKSVHEENAGH